MASMTISLALHLLLLAGFKASSDAPTTSRLGMPWISVQLVMLNESEFSPSHTYAKPAYAQAGKNRMAQAKIPQPLSEADTVTSPVVDDNTVNQDRPVTSGDKSRQLARNHLQGLVQSRLSRYLVYPPLARSRGWEGTVLMGLRVEPGGHLEKIHIARSSGYAVLDNSALNSLNRLDKLVEASAWLEDRGIDMQLPIIYQLIDN